ncbi:MAG: saccharopine dehydrogenase C-terminal domain-containing protein [Candidatus Hodarchaeales archaeon]|jgi:saccharopine dehydrogenase (NADP+, L-glutamate forming)/spermidine synthase
MKKVLILGAGLVARPITLYLLDQPDLEVLVASRTVSKAEKIVGDHPQGKAVAFNIEQEQDKLPDLIAQADVAISLLPYTYHVVIAEECIRQKKHLVTTSYVSDAMQALDEKAKAAGVILLNEIGVDPGTDHMSAMKIIDEVHAKGGQIESFESYCGGLPAPDNAWTNPFGYKLSWSPRGVLMAGRNAARFLKDGKQADIKGQDLFAHYERMAIEGLEEEYEIYPNRNSLPYINLYGIPETKTMFRGTIRNRGWCDTLKGIADLGLLEDEDKQSFKGMTYAGFFRKLLNLEADADIKHGIADKLGVEKDSEIIKRLEWLSLLSEDAIEVEEGTPLDILTARFMKLEYAPGEKDMLILMHRFVASYPDKKEQITSTMIDFGHQDKKSDSSMSRTVSLPAAIATRLILEGKITTPGVQIPNTKTWYEPVLQELEAFEIVFKEKVQPL